MNKQPRTWDWEWCVLLNKVQLLVMLKGDRTAHLSPRFKRWYLIAPGTAIARTPVCHKESTRKRGEMLCLLHDGCLQVSVSTDKPKCFRM